MLIIILAILLFLAWFAVAIIAMVSFVEEGISSVKGWACFAVAVVSLAGLLDSIRQQGQERPCAQYETRMMYNPAIKGPAPMRVCVLRGEWVEEEK